MCDRRKMGGLNYIKLVFEPPVCSMYCRTPRKKFSSADERFSHFNWMRGHLVSLLRTPIINESDGREATIWVWGFTEYMRSLILLVSVDPPSGHKSCLLYIPVKSLLGRSYTYLSQEPCSALLVISRTSLKRGHKWSRGILCLPENHNIWSLMGRKI